MAIAVKINFDNVYEANKNKKTFIMKNDKIVDRVNVLAEKNQPTDKPAKRRRLVSGKSSLSQFIRTKEQADEFMELLNKRFNRVS